MRINKKSRNILFIVIGIGLMIYTTISLYSGIAESGKIGITNTPPGNYLQLFNKSARQKLTINDVGSVYFKLRDTVSFFKYDNTYNIEVTKIRTGSNFNVKNDIIEEYTTPGGGTETNMPHYEDNLVVSYKAVVPDSAKQIYLSLVGDSVNTVVKNDS